jgi:phosphate/sulfate permease
MARLVGYGANAMAAWVEKKPLTRGQAVAIALWFKLVGVFTWTRLFKFVWTRGHVNLERRSGR